MKIACGRRRESAAILANHARPAPGITLFRPYGDDVRHRIGVIEIELDLEEVTGSGQTDFMHRIRPGDSGPQRVAVLGEVAAHGFSAAGRNGDYSWTSAGNGHSNLIDADGQHGYVGAVGAYQHLACSEGSQAEVRKLIIERHRRRTSADGGVGKVCEFDVHKIGR